MSKLDPASEDEPFPDCEEWVDWGGELVWAAGFTSGGAPYGFTLDEFRHWSMAAAPRAGWARSKRILERVFLGGRSADGHVEIGRINFVGEGLCRKAYVADVEFCPDRCEQSGAYVVLLPKPDVEPEFATRVRREATILHRLGRMTLPFRVPRIAGVMSDDGRPALVEEFVRGVPLDFRVGKHPGLKPWSIVGQLAAHVHAVDCGALLPILGGYTTRREHGEARLSIFEGLEDPLLREACDWARSHPPPITPAGLVHGDLLGQNIMRRVDDSRECGASPTLIDWEFACRGDPAYDLAVVTRGARRPFQVSGGLEKLLDEYTGAGGAPVTVSEVHFHELCLVAGWYRYAQEQGNGTPPPEHYLQQLRAVLRRARGRN